MRRFALAALLSLAAAAAGAQTMSEALTYSVNDYFGTARSIALGGAMTALGGDLGSIGINPAGSAVAPYSQFAISPGITILSNTSGYSTSYSEDYSGYLDYRTNKFNIPNLGFTLRFDTYNSSMKSFTLGFMSTATSHFMNDYVGQGINNKTSLLGSFGAGASPYTPSELNDRNGWFSSGIPWNYLAAYQGGMIAEAYDEYGQPMVDGYGNYTYLGATEAMFPNGDGSYDIRTQGQLDQYSRVQTYGAKYDILMNLGMNFNDRFFVGFNLGMPVATYRYSEYFEENAVDTADFPIEYADGVVTNFSSARYQYSQLSDISGVYLKAGFIWTPGGGLRVGAAVQTPTFMTIRDVWNVSTNTYFTSSEYNTSADSPSNDYQYNLISPWRLNAGVAYTLGAFGLVSADFEMADYSSMRFSESAEYYHNANTFRMENAVNRNFAGKEYSGRFGIEVRPVPSLSLRAGYALRTSPEYYAFDKNGVKYTAAGYINYYDEFESGENYITGKTPFGDILSTYSGGIGYSSDGSFFADFAFRMAKYPSGYFNPYGDYITGGDEFLPEVVQTRTMSDLVLTLGWRF
ncbi:MAG: hypothetical protein J5374_05645 [Bacteroidales bacterium]|nr:hypothetical protein [Bacteroidales bacterium]